MAVDGACRTITAPATRTCLPSGVFAAARLSIAPSWRRTGRQKWTTFILPSLFPYIATGAITASGGAWNASILAEYTTFGDTKYSTAYGIGAMIARSQDKNLYPQLMAATFAMVAAVIVVNRLVWKRLYQQAEETYRLD